MSTRVIFYRYRNERPFFIGCNIALFAALTIGFTAAMFDNPDPLFLIFAILVSIGGGWLFAIYMWNVNVAYRDMWKSWPKSGPAPDEKRDV